MRRMYFEKIEDNGNVATVTGNAGAAAA